ncbi:MAG: response regulator [Acidobacteriaceae bacterium]|nr:response regulator [Acidobacteriaceae bacterium]
MNHAKKIVIVEDEEIICADLSRTLQKFGYQVAGTASSGPEAIQIASTAQPDLVLMDVRLQGSMDGIEAARNIRKHSNVPILFVTAHAGARALNLSELPGKFGSIAKPFSPAQLRETIESILHSPG